MLLNSAFFPNHNTGYIYGFWTQYARDSNEVVREVWLTLRTQYARDSNEVVREVWPLLRGFDLGLSKSVGWPVTRVGGKMIVLIKAN